MATVALIRPTLEEDLQEVRARMQVATCLALLEKKIPRDIMAHVAAFLVSPYNLWLEWCLNTEIVPMGTVDAMTGKTLFNVARPRGQKLSIVDLSDTRDGQACVGVQKGDTGRIDYYLFGKGRPIDPDAKVHASYDPPHPTLHFADTTFWLQENSRIRGACFKYFPGSQTPHRLLIDRARAEIITPPGGSLALPETIPYASVEIAFGPYDAVFKNRPQGCLRLPSGWEICLSKTAAEEHYKYMSIHTEKIRSPLMTQCGWTLFPVSCAPTDRAAYVVTNIYPPQPPSPYAQLQLYYYLRTGRGADEIPAALRPLLPRLVINARFFSGSYFSLRDAQSNSEKEKPACLC